ncbi:uncharacterized protein LOC142771304 [Rhipicephalus microplus]|uniref:uncharacterized protein LOC142771304 n=1 Tax=Rhipicephalus microplus TaxID=6941 RepID=UPI003F6B09AB
MSDDEEDPLKVIISDPLIRRQFFRTPRRSPGERGATDDRPPNGAPFESSIIDGDKEEYVAIAVWIALALFAVAVSVVAGGPHPNVDTRVQRRGGGSAYAKILPARWRRGRIAGSPHSDESRNISLEQELRLSDAAAAAETGRKLGHDGDTKLEREMNDPSGVATEETAIRDETTNYKSTRTEQSSAGSRETADEDGRATEQPILLW